MANSNFLFKFIMSFEGGFSDHPFDRGGATNKGVTIGTWRKVGYDKDGDGDIDVDDLRLLSYADVRDRVFLPLYWNRWRAGEIMSQDVANLCVDWVWASGKHGITGVQKLLGVAADGIVGPLTLSALNAANPSGLFDAIKEARRAFLLDIVNRDSRQRVFLNGWMRRLECIQYGSLTLNTFPIEIINFKEL